MIVGIICFDILLFGPSSLKEKRSCVKRLVERIKSRFSVSVAEVDHQDLWQRTRIGIAVVGSDSRTVQSVLDRISDFVDSGGEYEVLERMVEIVRY